MRKVGGVGFRPVHRSGAAQFGGRVSSPSTSLHQTFQDGLTILTTDAFFRFFHS
ncbi:MAG: hypothetical protein AAFY21_01920 [Cyanobacteria bacterium J06641_2]